ncbi:oxidoreductase [Melanomma pulvis-pyrius CBS 109.77]|uniref:Oxidoreductase n=1 Tax=Melanomma pulvis-pyrius CBS 109.77 TaxID=1314802 RepID=A0A6A6XPS7_9PLEO|nr:oxidoreductase [Melanomma pulvis-pyrius CBS 109.77]
MSFLYKHVLLIGATSGIGAAMADHLIKSGVQVTAVGRRKERLDEFVCRHGEKASRMVFDIAKLDEIPTFVSSVTTAYPTIDCIFLNAGIQHRYDFAKPSTLDLPRFHHEITTNFLSFVALTHAFMPHLLSCSSPTGIIYTGTHLSLVPAYTMPAYSASKAALDAFVISLREQLNTSNIRVTSISAPPVQTELHDFEMGIEAGRALGMPVEQFTHEAYLELVRGNENIIIGGVGGSTKEQFLEIVERRKEAFERLGKLLRG